MKLGFGLYRHMLDHQHLKFAKQMGATHIVVHMCDYFNLNEKYQIPKITNQPIGGIEGWGRATGEIWSIETLSEIKSLIESHGLIWYAIENFDPKHWDHILFGGDQKKRQLKIITQIIQNVGHVGIPVFGYNFSLTGVTGRIIHQQTRGNAQSVGMNGLNAITDTPLPNTMAWNMIVDETAKGLREVITEKMLWDNLNYFLQEIIPIAEASGVILAAHPDDPPLETVRGLPKLVNHPEKYQRLLDLYPSESNKLEYCLGTMAEMPFNSELSQFKDIYTTTAHYASQKKIGYIHLRNVIGQVPNYREVFIDEGDIDIKKIIQILKENQFDGVIIPDHTPQVSCNSPWHAGMAFAMGYINALIK